MLEIDFSGLEDLQRRAKELGGENKVSLGELFDQQFMRKNTQHSTIEAFLEATGYAIESQEDFEAIPDDEFNEFVRDNTRFSSWEEMLEAAGVEWVQRQLGLD